MKKLCFDLDGVICNTTKNYYKKSTPKKKVIEAINKLYKSNHITIFTSRYMGEGPIKVSDISDQNTQVGDNGGGCQPPLQARSQYKSPD